MIRVEASRVIARPIQHVWAYISNLDNMTEWDPGVVSVKWQPPLHEGTRYEIRDSSLLFRVASPIVRPVITVTDFEEGRRFAEVITRGASSFKVVYTLESLTPASTRVTRSHTIDGRGIYRLWEFLGRGRVLREREYQVENLKRVLEAPAHAPD